MRKPPLMLVPTSTEELRADITIRQNSSKKFVFGLNKKYVPEETRANMFSAQECEEIEKIKI